MFPVSCVWIQRQFGSQRGRQQGKWIRKPLGNILCSSWNHNQGHTHTHYIFLCVTNVHIQRNTVHFYYTGHTLYHTVFIHSENRGMLNDILWFVISIETDSSSPPLYNQHKSLVAGRLILMCINSNRHTCTEQTYTALFHPVPRGQMEI